MRASGTWAAPFGRVITLVPVSPIGCSARARREELASQAHDQVAETPAVGDEGALPLGPVCRCEALDTAQRTSATGPDRRVPAIGQ